MLSSVLIRNPLSLSGIIPDDDGRFSLLVAVVIVYNSVQTHVGVLFTNDTELPYKMILMELFIILLALSGTITLSLVVYGWQRRAQTIGRLFAYTMGCLFIWIVATILEYLAHTLSVKLFWANTGFFGITLLPVFWLLVVIEYTDKQQQWQRYRSWLFVIPIISNLLIWTNRWHHWWRGISALTEATPLFLLVEYDYQFTFYIHALYGYILLLFSIILLLQKMRVTKGIYRRQIALLLTSILLPIISDTLYVLGLSPIPNFNFTPIIFAFSGVLIAVALFRHRFLDLMPVARNKLVENMSDAMLVLDEKNRIIDLNPSMLTILNMESGQVIGSVADSILNEWGMDWGWSWETAVSHQEIMITRDGVQTHYGMHISPLRESEGIATGQLILMRDITRRVQLENDLRLQNEDLEAFAHMVAHDLKNPLTTIMGISELLPLLSPVDDAAEMDEYLHVLQGTAKKMDSIIHALLLLARVRQQEVVVRPLNMAVVVAEVLGRLYYAVDAADAVIVQPDSWPDVVSYAPWLEEIWVNYVSNGLKYGGQPPHLTLGFTPQEDGSIRFWVLDNGDGIDPADYDRVFSAFTRLDETRAEGHGLGLSIVSRIIARLGGSAGVESGENGGSLFYFSLPVTAVENN